ncbi:MAG: hypothetical protein J0G29_07810, partial [Alphaproteobacteria bacterium]|nr:hypothetical protein [Alphaproteobacteria bacterium]
FDDDQGNNSDTVVIEQIKQLVGQFKVFNFGVDTYHTYFIGDGAYVLVHNEIVREAAGMAGIDKGTVGIVGPYDVVKAASKFGAVEANHVIAGGILEHIRGQTRGAGIAITTDIDLHRLLRSTGSYKGAMVWQATQKVYIDNGDWFTALKMEVSDLKSTLKHLRRPLNEYNVAYKEAMSLFRERKHIDGIQLDALNTMIDGDEALSNADMKATYGRGVAAAGSGGGGGGGLRHYRSLEAGKPGRYCP